LKYFLSFIIQLELYIKIRKKEREKKEKKISINNIIMMTLLIEREISQNINTTTKKNTT